MNEVTFVIVIAMITITFLTIYILQNRDFREERAKWQAERQKLLDRIQAPSFAEYAAKDLREKRIEAAKEEKEPKPQFIS